MKQILLLICQAVRAVFLWPYELWPKPKTQTNETQRHPKPKALNSDCLPAEVPGPSVYMAVQAPMILLRLPVRL